MGTNYYIRHNICEPCGRYDEMHVGKNYTTFEGHFTEYESGQSLPLITSWQQWKERLLAGDCELWDEYGTKQDVDQFVSLVEVVPEKNRRKQFDAVSKLSWAKHERHGEAVPGSDWLDPDGYSFHGGPFS